MPGPEPLPSRGGVDKRIVEVERTVARAGTVSLGSRTVPAAWSPAGHKVGIYIEEGCPLLVFDPVTRELLRTRLNPLDPGEAARLQRPRPVGPVPRPSTEPIRVQPRADHTGMVMVAGQEVAQGRQHQRRAVTIHVAETMMAIELDEEEAMVVRRTTDQAVRNLKPRRPRTATTDSQ